MFISSFRCVLCSLRPLRRANHSFRGVIQCVGVCMCVCVCLFVRSFVVCFFVRSFVVFCVCVGVCLIL